MIICVNSVYAINNDNTTDSYSLNETIKQNSDELTNIDIYDDYENESNIAEIDYSENSNENIANDEIDGYLDDIKNSTNPLYYDFVDYLINEHHFELRKESKIDEGYLMYATQNSTFKLYDGSDYLIQPNETYFVSTNTRTYYILNEFYPDIVYLRDGIYYLDEEYVGWLKWNYTTNITINATAIENITIENRNTRHNAPISLPSKYDSRDYGFVTPVKNQGAEGNCWAFASIAALETYLLKFENKNYKFSNNLDFSENHLKNVMSSHGKQGNKTLEVNKGGNIFIPIAYFLRWSGPINETLDVYGSGDYSNEDLRPEKHVQGIRFINPRSNYLDNNEIKECIYKYGSVVTNIFWNTTYENELHTTYNCIDPLNYKLLNKTWHAITIIGWDDNYSFSNFKAQPSYMKDGAFIVKNSYGNTQGTGYYYVSYYDTSLAFVTQNNYAGFAFSEVENKTNYGSNYNYSPLGLTSWLNSNSNSITYYNQWVSNKNEVLKACGLYTTGTSTHKIDVYVNNVPKTTTTYTSNYAGYHTIPLNNVQLLKGDKFKIQVTSMYPTTPSEGIIALSSNTPLLDGFHKNISFIYAGSGNWKDVEELFNMTICLNAYTDYGGYIDTKINVNDFSMNYQDGNEIKAYLKDSNNNPIPNKEVTIHIHNTTYTLITDNNGFVHLPINLKPNIYRTEISFYGDNKYKEFSKLIDITVKKGTPTLTANSGCSYGEKLSINLKYNNKALSKKVVSITVNGVTYEKTTDSNGVAYLPIHLNDKTYSITIKYAGDTKYNSVSKTISFTVTKASAKLSTTGLKAQYNSGKAIEVKVINTKNNNPLDGVKVAFKVYTGNDYKMYYADTNANGIAKFYASKLSLGKHNVEISSGIKYVTATTIKSTIEITKANTVVSAPKVTNTYQTIKYFKVTVSHKISEKPISGLDLNLKIYTGANYKSYSVTTNDNGVASFNTKNLAVGDHKVVIESANNKYSVSGTSTITITK